MDELWLFCDVCDEENTHQVLKSRTSAKKGFSFQGVVKCQYCGTTSSKEVNEELPLNLKLRISSDNETVNDILTIDENDKGVSIFEPWRLPDGLFSSMSKAENNVLVFSSKIQ